VAVEPDNVDRQQLLTILTTEHFGLQGSRASTVGESSSRAALFVGAVSSVLVALGFIANADPGGDAFDLFGLVALPTLYMLGLFTFIRLVELSLEDLFYGKAINRIRGYYEQVAGPEAQWMALGSHDDTIGVLANMGLPKPSRWQLYFTLAGMINVLNAIVGGTAIAFVTGVIGAPLGAAAAIGGVVAVVSFVSYVRWQRAQHVFARETTPALSPTPT
jgi:hypothetical protein